jgi:hypothetical protein
MIDKNKFDKYIDEQRQKGKTDTEILNDLGVKDPGFGKKVLQSRAMYAQPNTNISNDRDLLNYLSQGFTGNMPTVESVSVEGRIKERFAELDDKEIDEETGELVDSPGFFSRVGSSLKERAGNIKDIMTNIRPGTLPTLPGMLMSEAVGAATKDGKITPAEGVLQTAGQIAGAGSDVVGEAVSPLIEAGIEAIPDETKQKLLNDPAVQFGLEVFEKGADHWEMFRTRNPRIAANMEAAGLVAEWVPIGKTLGLTSKGVGKGLVKTADKLESSVRKQAVQEAEEAIIGIPTSGQIKKAIKKGQRGKTTIFQGSKLIATPDQLAAAQDLAGVVSSKKDAFLNLINLDDKVSEISEGVMKKLLRDNNSVYDTSDLKKYLIAKSADAARVLKPKDKEEFLRQIDVFMGLVDENHPTLANLWDTRKRWDDLIEETYGGNVLTNPAAPSSERFTVRKMRQLVNSFIDETADSAAFRDDMRRLTRLYDVYEPLAQTASREMKKPMIEKAKKGVQKAMSTAGKVGVGAGIATGSGMIAPGAIFAMLSNPMLLGTIATYGGGKECCNI